MENRALYVSASGSDENSGLSAEVPLKTLAAGLKKLASPGDTLLLRCGDVFEGDAELSASGAQGSPIKISSYGEGAKPLISDFVRTGIVFTGEYIEVENLAFSSPRGDAGMRFMALGSGAYRGLKVSSCAFRHINTLAETGSHSRDTGGVAFMATGDKEPVWFEDVLVENCEFDTLGRAAVHACSFWCARDLDQTWGTYNLRLEGNPLFFSKNVVVRGCRVDHCSGDAISLFGCVNAVIEHNVVANTELLYNNFDHNIAMVPIWFHTCDDSIIQYNEVYGNRNTNRAQDLQAFDIDLSCNRCIVQYNYSHDNQGGFLLLCSTDGRRGGGVNDTVVRYNLSVNDADECPWQVIDISSGVFNTHIYNNTIYMGRSGRVVNHSNYMKVDLKSTTLFENNIFCSSDDAATYFGFGDVNTAPAFESVEYRNNLFFNIAEPEFDDLVKISGSVFSDPHFVNPGAEEKGLENGKNYAPRNPELLSAGAEIPDNGGKDYFGNPAPKNLIGAIAPLPEE